MCCQCLTPFSQHPSLVQPLFLHFGFESQIARHHLAFSSMKAPIRHELLSSTLVTCHHVEGETGSRSLEGFESFSVTPHGLDSRVCQPQPVRLVRSPFVPEQ